MKHLALDYHFVCKYVQNDQLQVSYISTKDQLADGLTKPLSRPRFLFLCSKIGVADDSTILWGHIKDTHPLQNQAATVTMHQKQKVTAADMHNTSNKNPKTNPSSNKETQSRIINSKIKSSNNSCITPNNIQWHPILQTQQSMKHIHKVHYSSTFILANQINQ